MMRNKRNGLPDACMCDEHTVHSDELFVMRRNNRNGQLDEGVCDIQHTVHSDELFVIGNTKEKVSPMNVHAIDGI